MLWFPHSGLTPPITTTPLTASMALRGLSASRRQKRPFHRIFVNCW